MARKKITGLLISVKDTLGFKQNKKPQNLGSYAKSILKVGERKYMDR